MARITCLILDWGTKILSAVQCDQKPKKLKNERERRSETTNQSLKKKERKKKKMGGNYWVFKIRDVPNIP